MDARDSPFEAVQCHFIVDSCKTYPIQAAKKQELRRDIVDFGQEHWKYRQALFTTKAHQSLEFGPLPLTDAPRAEKDSCGLDARKSFLDVTLKRPPGRNLLFIEPRVQPSRFETCRDVTNLRRSEEHTSELQSLRHLVCRLL